MTDLRTSVAEAARRLADEGLLIGTAGNVSARDGDRVAVTATGVVLGRCTPEDVTIVSTGGEVLEGRLAPTSELDLHLGVYADTGAAAVVHTHAPWSTAVACVLDELPVLHYQQLTLGGAIRVAPYATFGTPELARAVREAPLPTIPAVESSPAPPTALPAASSTTEASEAVTTTTSEPAVSS